MFHPGSRHPGIVVPGATPAELQAADRWLAGLLSLPRFAHHPACEYWSNHLIRVGSVPVCLGCCCMSLGIVAGVLLVYPWLASSVTPLSLFMLGVLCYVPTTIQIYIQTYAFKVGARFALGVGIVLALGAAILGHPWDSAGAVWNLVFLAVFVALLVGTLRWRARHLDVPCVRCPDGRFPFCAWRLSELREALDHHDRGDRELPESLIAFVRVVAPEISREPGARVGLVRFVNVEHCEPPA